MPPACPPDSRVSGLHLNVQLIFLQALRLILTVQGTEREAVKHNISSEARNKTTKCAHNFSCLEDGLCANHPVCKPVSENNCPVLFIEANSLGNCPYRTTFGYDQVCLCPIHKEIVNKQA